MVSFDDDLSFILIIFRKHGKWLWTAPALCGGPGSCLNVCQCSSPSPKSCLPLSLPRLPGRPKPPPAPLPLEPKSFKRMDDLLRMLRKNGKASQGEEQEEKRVVDRYVQGQA